MSLTNKTKRVYYEDENKRNWRYIQTKIEELEIEFVATGSGHQSISEAEKLIRSIRENLGSFNVSKTDFTNIHLNQLLEKIFLKINKGRFQKKEK